LSSLARGCVLLTGTYAVAAGLVSFLGWALDIPRLADWDGNGIAIQPNTTLAVMGAGATLLFLASGWNRVALLGAVFVGVIGATALFQFSAGVDLGIDTQLLFGRTWGSQGTLSVGRMGPPASVSWTVLGAGLAFAASEVPALRRIAPKLGLFAAGIGSLSLIGYAFGVHTLYSLPRLTTIALQTATMILAVAIGVIASVPEQQPMRRLLEESAAGLLARRAIPFLVLLPICVGLLRLRGQEAGLYDTAFGTAVLVLVLMILLLALLWWATAVVAAHERRVRGIRERLEGVLASISDRFQIVDREWRLTYQNAAMRRALSEEGIDADLALGRDFFERSPEFRGAKAAQALQRAMNKRTEVEFEVLHGAARLHWFNVRASPAPDGGLAILSRDVTDRKRAERAVIENEKQLRLVTAHLPVRVAYCDTRTNFKFVNEPCARSLGLPPEEIIGKGMREILGEKYTPALERHVEDSLAGSTVVAETEVTDELEERCFLRSTFTPERDGDGRVVGLVISTIDITDRKHAEEEREALLARECSARTAAERAGRIKDEFLATLSHELRTPLNAIMGWTHLLLQKPLPEDRLDQGLAVIGRNARLQAQLISDLLDMSRIISGKMRLEVQRVELPAIIEASLESIRPAADAKSVRIQSIVDPILHPVHGDPARLQQVVWNLLSNAVKFTPRGGRVQVVLARVESHVVLSVSDTGEGMPAEFLPHLFERFLQADSSATREHGGLGLGLAIVKQLVELHGGRVHASSDGEGRGSTFVVELPLAVLSETPAATPTETRPSTQTTPPARELVHLDGVRVVIVDDDPDARVLLRRLLEECNAEVRVADSASAALALLKEFKADVVISDIGMPRVDGYEFISRARAEGLAAPAIALTAFARSEDRTRALLSGYQSHVTKPVAPPELLATVTALLGRPPTGGDRTS
jgi:PAS domain S-box-containing protein